jgi:hypothetical protein
MTVTLTRPTPESVAAHPEVRELMSANDPDEAIGWEQLDDYVISELVWYGQDQGLFGPNREVAWWTTADSEGIRDGGLLTVDLGPGLDAPRLCSLHTEHRNLCTAHSEGEQLAAEILTTLKFMVDQMIAELGRWSRGGE